ncbi:hypothetical protein ACGRRZ_09590 [Vibrio diabolicus]|uniref:hypothetical protein n=1 Tax=Vibrio diabolicus TaxID=50719 RepID=UPI003749157B
MNPIDFRSQKVNKALQTLIDRVHEERNLAQVDFDTLVSKGTIRGQWDESGWQYRGRTIYFRGCLDINGAIVTSHTKIEDSVLMQGIWGDIYRLFTLHSIKKHKSGNERTIPGLLSRIAWLGTSLNFDENALLSMDQSKIDALIPLLQTYYEKPRGTFERYKDSVSFIKNFVVKKSFCKTFVPKVNMKNPALERNDVTTNTKKEAQKEKHVEDIGLYFGRIKQKFDAAKRLVESGGTPEYFQPKDGYDELRLLATPFMEGLGLRIGEVLRLHKDCLGFDEDRQRYFLRVPVEKGELAFAKSIPKIWEKVIVDAHARILEITKPHRDFARKVEQEGAQAFINSFTFPDRPENFENALKEHGYDPNLHFARSEIGTSGDIHVSGLTVSLLRESKAIQGRYSQSIVGKLKCKYGDERAARQRVIISKEELSKLCLKEYEDTKRMVYRANDNVDAKEEIVSTSYTIDMPFSEFLFIAKNDTFDAGTKSHGLIPCPLTYRAYTRWINNDEKGSRHKTIFENYDIKDENGDVVSLNSHQIRHWVTTALIRAGKNESAIDLWMGRTPGQTRHYDHRTAKERAEAMRKRYMSENPPDDVLGRRIKRMRNNNVSLDEIETALNHTMSAVHYTPWGTCDRDLDVSPCQKGMMCLRGNDGETCNHFGIDPTDKEALVNIHNTKVHYENQLSALLPNYDELSLKLNNQEPLDQHVQFCIDTINGCIAALKAYENAEKNEAHKIPIVQIFNPENIKDE